MGEGDGFNKPCLLKLFVGIALHCTMLSHFASTMLFSRMIRPYCSETIYLSD